MKKYLFLGLLLMLLAPLPASSAKYVTLLVNSPNSCGESAQNIYSLEGGTFCGLADVYIGHGDFSQIIVKALKYEFDDNQTQTRLHVNLKDVSIAVRRGYHNPEDPDYIYEGAIFIGPTDITTSEYISEEFYISSEDDYYWEDNYLFVEVYRKKTVNFEFLGDGLSAQLRDNYREPQYLEGGKLVYFDHFNVLDQKTGPLENVNLEGYSHYSSSLCINGFNWNDTKKSLLVIVDGDTIKNINQYREEHCISRGREWESNPVRYVVGDGVDFNFINNSSVYAKIIDVPDEFEQYPVTYKINSAKNVSVKSVDKSYSGNLELGGTIIGNYLSNWTIYGIEDQAMLNCKNITSLYIPASVSTIGVNALSGMTSLKQIDVSSDNSKFASIDGVLFNKSQTRSHTLIQFPIAKATQYEVPEGTWTIERDAFYKSELTSITLPSTLTTINYDAFGYSKQLKEIDIPSSVTKLGEYVFDHCTGLTRVSLPSMISLPRYFFSNCTALPTVDLPNKLQSIEDYAFTNCTALSNIVLPDGLQTIGNYAFNKCNKITNIKLPAGMQTIEENAFKGCDNLNKVVCEMPNPIPLPDNAFTDNVYNNAVLKVPYGALALYKSANGWKKFKNIIEFIAFEDKNVEAICLNNWDTNGDSELDYTEAEAVTSLGDAFTGNTTIKIFNELKYFDGLTKIDDNAFRGCKSLKSVCVPSSVKQLGKYAFYSCYALTDIVLPEGLEVINDFAIGACTKLVGIELPSTLTTIKKKAFYYDKVLTSINIPASVTSIEASAFATCPLLMEVTANMMKPCTIAANVFPEDTYSKGTLNIPYGTYDIYKTTNYWSKFVNIKTLAGQVAIDAAPISIVAGESGDMVLRLDGNLPSVSFQFDLTLATGITLQSATVIPSTDFVVNTAKIGTNKWRIVAYSLSNTPFNSNIGDLMTMKLQTAELLYAGTRNVTISNFSFATLGSSNLISSTALDDITTTITVIAAPVTDAGKGDVNLDGAVNVQDVVVLNNYLFGTTPNKFSVSNADANNDGLINVADISTIISLCMPNNNNAAPAHAPAASLASMTWDTSNGLSLTIDDATLYVAAQMDVTVDGSLQVNNITAADGHTPVWQQIGENRYRILVFSSTNDMFSAFGPHLFFDVQGEGEITLSNGLLVDAAGDGYNAAPSSTGVTTRITSITTELSTPADVYSVSGQLIRSQATSLKNLPAGIYIVNGRKVAVK